MFSPLKVLVNLRVAAMKRKSSFMAWGWESSQDIEYVSLANLAKSKRRWAAVSALCTYFHTMLPVLEPVKLLVFGMHTQSPKSFYRDVTNKKRNLILCCSTTPEII